jgi:hypothetical protein
VESRSSASTAKYVLSLDKDSFDKYISAWLTAARGAPHSDGGIGDAGGSSPPG